MPPPVAADQGGGIAPSFPRPPGANFSAFGLPASPGPGEPPAHPSNKPEAAQVGATAAAAQLRQINEVAARAGSLDVNAFQDDPSFYSFLDDWIGEGPKFLCLLSGGSCCACAFQPGRS